MRSQEPELIYLKVSVYYRIILGIFYASSASTLFLLSWPLYIRLLIFGLMLADYYRVLHLPRPVLIFKDCDKWQYELSTGKRYKARIADQDRFFSDFLLVAKLEHLGGSRHIFVWRDAVNNDQFRALAAIFGK